MPAPASSSASLENSCHYVDTFRLPTLAERERSGSPPTRSPNGFNDTLKHRHPQGRRNSGKKTPGCRHAAAEVAPARDSSHTDLRMEWLSNPEIWISLVTLTVLEVVLGIDNIVFISILAGKLPRSSRRKPAASASCWRWLRASCFCAASPGSPGSPPRSSASSITVSAAATSSCCWAACSCIYKAAHEIHEKLEGEDGARTSKLAPTFASVIVQILLIDIVFSLDSVITAVGMVAGTWGDDRRRHPRDDCDAHFVH